MSTNVQSAYKLEWMDSCLHETLLPGSPWHKVHQQSCKVFFMKESFIYRLSHVYPLYTKSLYLKIDPPGTQCRCSP